MRKPVRLAALAVASLIAFTVGAAAQAAPSVDDIIAKNLKARGGEAKLRSLNTMRINGKVAVQGMELPMIVTAKRPNLMRQEMQIQDKKVVTTFDGETAWMINPMMGADAPQEVPGPQGQIARDQADFDGPFMDYKTKGHTIELVKGEAPDGTDKLADGTKVYKLKVTRKSGRSQTYYLDADSGIEVRTTSQIEQGTQTMTIDTELADYRPVDGVMVPHSVRNIMNGTPMMTMTVDKVEFNVPIEDSIFKLGAKP